MDAWQLLTVQENDEVWHWFDTIFDFAPQLNGSTGIREPSPSKTYQISDAYQQTQKEFETLEYDLHEKTLRAFRRLIKCEDFLFALDWQHDCYRFWPQHP